jgi:hypothetical protein
LTAEQVALGRRLIDEGKSVREVARVILKFHPATLYREFVDDRQKEAKAHYEQYSLRIALLVL